MKILILRGGAPAPQRPGDDSRQHSRQRSHQSTRSRGVIALGNGSGQWVLINMSPAVAHQLHSDAALQHHPGLQDAEVRAVVLTDAQVDHVGGLLSLRDGPAIDLYVTPTVFEQLTTALPVLPVLQHYCGVQWWVVPVAGDRRVASFRVDGLPTLEFTAVATQARQPPHLAHTEAPQVGDSIALAVVDLATGQRLFCAPGLAQLGAVELDWMHQADCLLLDGLPALSTAWGVPGADDAAPAQPAQAALVAQPPAGPATLAGHLAWPAGTPQGVVLRHRRPAARGLGRLRHCDGPRRHGDRPVMRSIATPTRTQRLTQPRAFRRCAPGAAAATTGAA